MATKKQVIKLNEKQLRRVVAESVRNFLYEGDVNNEANSNDGSINRDGVIYYPIGNTSEYVRNNNLQTSVMYKVGKVKARPAVNGRQNQGTNLEGGFAERDGYVENGDSMIVRNPRGEEYQVPNDEFARKYTLDPNSQPDAEGYRVYNAFDKRIVSSPVKHNVYKDMSAYWGPGQKQFGRAGDAHIVNPDNDDSYFIGDKELKDTHVSNPNGMLNENRLIQTIMEAVMNEINGDFKSVTNKADQYFQGNNKAQGFLRRTLHPKKYQQLQNVKNKGKEMGAASAKELNKIRDEVPRWGESHYPYTDDYVNPFWAEYAAREGLVDLDKVDYGHRVDVDPYYGYSVSKTLNTRGKEIPYYASVRGTRDPNNPKLDKLGQDLYNKRARNAEIGVKKYGTGGVNVHPLSYATDDESDERFIDHSFTNESKLSRTVAESVRKTLRKYLK